MQGAEKGAIDTPVTRLEKQMKHNAGMEGTQDGNQQWRTIAQRVVHGQKIELPGYQSAARPLFHDPNSVRNNLATSKPHKASIMTHASAILCSKCNEWLLHPSFDARENCYTCTAKVFTPNVLIAKNECAQNLLCLAFVWCRRVCTRIKAAAELKKLLQATKIMRNGKSKYLQVSGRLQFALFSACKTHITRTYINTIYEAELLSPLLWDLKSPELFLSPLAYTSFSTLRVPFGNSTLQAIEDTSRNGMLEQLCPLLAARNIAHAISIT